MPEDNGKQDSDVCYMYKYQNHISCSYGYKLECADDEFRMLLSQSTWRFYWQMFY